MATDMVRMAGILAEGELILVDGEPMMSSLDIARFCEKQHQHVMRDIRSMLAIIEAASSVQIWTQLFAMKAIRKTYKAENGKRNPYYLLDEEMAYTLVSGYDTLLRNRIIREWLALKKGVIFWQAARSLSKDNYEAMSAALYDARTAMGKETKTYHYSNEARLLWYAVWGEFKKKAETRDELSAEDLAALDAAECANKYMLDMGMEYEERKALLPEMVVKERRRHLVRIAKKAAKAAKAEAKRLEKGKAKELANGEDNSDSQADDSQPADRD